MVDARRLAQIAVFVVGLLYLDSLLNSLLWLAQMATSDYGVEPAYFLLPAGHTLFVLTLIFAPGGWAKLLNVPGSVSTFAQFTQDDLVRTLGVGIGLYFLVSGVADAVGGVVSWQQARAYALDRGIGNPMEYPRYPDLAPFLRAVLGAALVLWGARIPNVLSRLRTAGHSKSAA